MIDPVAFGNKTANPHKRKLQRKMFGSIMRNHRCRHKKEPFTIVCMPSTTCWDTEYFLQYEFTNIVALERDPEAAAYIRNKYKNNPRVTVVESDTISYFSKTDLDFNLIYLDYFSNFNFHVEYDLRMVFRRNILKPTGMFAVNFMGARETSLVQVRNEMLIEDMFAKTKIKKLANDIENERCLAFNSLVARYRWRKRAPTAPAPYVKTTAPRWYKYKNNHNMYFYSAVFTLNSYSAKASSRVIKMSPNSWLATNNYEPKEILAHSLTGINSDEYWISKIKAFYQENFYTPNNKDFHLKHVKCWNGLIEEAGLCPRVHASEKQILGELKRIEKREGAVNFNFLKRAKLNRKNSTSLNTEIKIIEFCKTNDIRYIKNQSLFELERLKLWKQHIIDGQNKTDFPFYGWIRKNGWHLNFDKVLNHLKRFEFVKSVD